jgi:Lecithin:cholesterol acyltransferase
MVAHSMGNTIFRYFLTWLRLELRQESYERSIKQYRRRAQAQKVASKSVNMAGIPGSSSTTNADLQGWMYAPSLSDAATGIQRDSTLYDPSPEHDTRLHHLAELEGDEAWLEWIERHIWTYVGLSAPMLGAVNPLRSVVSGENMGVPISEEVARNMELTFGATHTVSPVSTKAGFCDEWDFDTWDEEPRRNVSARMAESRLACLDDISREIENSSSGANTETLSGDKDVNDPWQNFPALKGLLHQRIDWDTDLAMFMIQHEQCEAKEKSPCFMNRNITLGPLDVQSGEFFETFNSIWKEEKEPLLVKREQLRESFWDTNMHSILNTTWERPLIKHVIMAYGVDIPTEVGYIYGKTDRAETLQKEYDSIPNLKTVVWEDPGGKIVTERTDEKPGFLQSRRKKRYYKDSSLKHSGDGSVPYLSLSWAHTWLLHSLRAARHSANRADDGNVHATETLTEKNPLSSIQISHRPKGATEWNEGPPQASPNPQEVKDDEDNAKNGDTGTQHPHGTRYKPEMIRYHSNGTSRTTGIEYTTSVIEAIGVEHKETTR